MQPTKWNTKTNLSQKVCLIVSCDISTNVLENSPYRIMQPLIQSGFANTPNLAYFTPKLFR